MAEWRRNLYLLWVCNFIVQTSFSLVIPFLPYYVAQLGVGSEPQIQWWSGLIFAANFVTMTVFSPIWGAVADRTGRRRQMLRSGYGMAVVVSLMGLAASPWHLLGLRLLQGVFSGFIPAAVAFMAASAPPSHTGYALGLLQTGGAAGSIIGPLLGGLLAKALGTYRPIFFLTGLGCATAATLVLLLVRERFTPLPPGQGNGFWAGLRQMVRNPALVTLCAVYFFNYFAIMTAQPVISLFLHHLDTPAEWVDLAAGLIFSATGVAQLLAAPLLGRRGDRLGYRRVLLICTAASAALYLVQSFVTAAWQLLALRFLVGACLGGIQPSASALVARAAGREGQGRAFGLTNMAVFIGTVLGPLAGGAVAAALGTRAVFAVTAAVMGLSLLWVAARVPADLQGARAG